MSKKVDRVIACLNNIVNSVDARKSTSNPCAQIWQEVSSPELMAGSNVLVSVIMTAYNNASTIELAVKSVVEQKTKFPFEVLIGVDHCTDNTLEMAKKCQEKWPDKVRVCYPSVNVGYQANRDYLHNAARATGGIDGGGYFAYCEADDAWDASDTKLAEQIALVESHPTWVGCVGPVRRIMNDGKIVLPDDAAISKKGVIKCGTIGSAYYHTTSYIFRRATYEKCHGMAPDLPEWMDILILIGANTLGDIGYWRKIGSTHYITERGMYTSLSDTERLLWELPYYIDWLKHCKSKDGQNLVLGILFRAYRRKGEMNKLWDSDAQLMRKLMCEIAHSLPLFSRAGIFARFKLHFSKQYRARVIGGFGEKFVLGLVKSNKNARKKKVVLVVHSAGRTRAPFLALHLARSFVNFGYELTIVLLGKGPLVDSFSKIARTVILRAFDFPDVMRTRIKQLFNEGYRNVYLNTVVSGALAKDFKNQGFNVVTLIHEMDYSVHLLNLEKATPEICEYSDVIVVASRVVSDSWRKIGVEVPEDKLKVLPQHNYHVQIRGEKPCAKARKRIRRRYKISEDEIIVLACGEIGFRKGINQFLDLAEELAIKAENVRLMWVGAMPNGLRDSAPDVVSRIVNAKNCVFTGFQTNIADFYNAADIYLCCSESDAFPTVVLEAALCKLPVVLAEGYTGVADLFQEAPAGLCKELSGHALASEIIKLISDKTLWQKASDYAYKIGCDFNDFSKYAANLLKLYVGHSL